MYVCHIGNSFYSEIINTAKSKKKKKKSLFSSLKILQSLITLSIAKIACIPVS